MRIFLRIIFLITLFLNAGLAHAISLKDYLALPANPMKINVTLDKEKVSKKILAKSGGTILLTIANGDSFELNLLPNSLAKDTIISLQKVKTIKHPKIGGAVVYSSVEIFPDGLELKIPATLKFKTKNDFPIKSLTPFSAQGSGDETHLTTLVGSQSSKEIKIGIVHFSNYTIADSESLDEIIDQGMSRMEFTRIGNWFSREILKEKRTGEANPSAIDNIINEAFKTVVMPSILSAQSCASGKNALSNFLEWSRQTSLLGRDPSVFFPADFQVSLVSMISDVSELCLELAKVACIQDHHPIKAMDYTLKLERESELVGATEMSQKLQEFRNKCMKFKFFMESEIWTGESRADSTSVTIKSEFNFSLSPIVEDPIEGTIEVTSTDLNIYGFNCTKTSFEAKPSKILIDNFLYLKLVEEDKLTVKIGNLMPEGVANFRCVDQDSGTTINMTLPPAGGSYWGGLFMGTHGPTGLNEFDMKTGFFVTKDWNVHYDTKYATKEYTQTVQDSLNETTTLIIYHTPDAL